MDSKYSSEREKANLQQQYVSSTNPSEQAPTAPQEAVTPTGNYPNLSEDVPPSYAQSQQQPFINQPLPYPHQNQPFPQQQEFSPQQPPFNQQQPFHQQQFPQPQPYPQPYPQAPVQQINIVQMALDKYPINTTCPACKASITTAVRMETHIVAHVIAGVLCFMCCCPCAILPYCFDSFKSAIHSCPDCRAYIGTYDPQTNMRHHSRVGRRNW